MKNSTILLTVVLAFAWAAAATEELAPPPALDAAAEVPIRFSFPEATPVSEIYRVIGEAAGVEIIFDPHLDVQEVAVALDTATTSEALDLVAAAAGDLWVPTAGDAVIVADDTPQNHRRYEPVVVRSFVLENGDVREADKLLRGILGVHSVSVDPTLKTLTVREPAATMPLVERLVALADHEPGEIDARLEVLRLRAGAGAAVRPRLSAREYADWIRGGHATVLAVTSLSVIDGRRASLHLGAVDGTDRALDIGIEGRVHPHSNEVTLEIRASLSPSGPSNPNEEGGRPSPARIEFSARVGDGTTMLLRTPGSGSDDLAIAITPTVVRGAEFDQSLLDAVWAGTESRIRASR